MRIIHVTDFGRAGKINGVSEAVLNLAHAQKDMGHTVLVCHTRPNSMVSDPICNLTDSTGTFLRLLAEFHPHIVIFNSFYDFKHPLFARKLKQLAIPYLITFHGGASRNNYRKKRIVKFFANKLVFKPYINGACGVCYLNEGERANSIFKFAENKSIIIPNGISCTQLISGASLKSNPQQTTISFISRLDFKGKGIDLLLNAIKNIEDWLKENHVVFNFYGYHYSDGTVELINAFKERCKYMGFVSGKEKENAYSTTDIVILPSRSEGMPIGILEALSYGVPCIVTPQTNMADVIQKYDCGWVCQLNAESISATIIKAINDLSQKRTEIRDNAIRAARNYDWTAIALRSIEIYKNLI